MIYVNDDGKHLIWNLGGQLTFPIQFCILYIPEKHSAPAGSPDKSSVLSIEYRATNCGQHNALEIQITNVELGEMTFTAASRMNTATELRASVVQLWVNSSSLAWMAETDKRVSREGEIQKGVMERSTGVSVFCSAFSQASACPCHRSRRRLKLPIVVSFCCGLFHHITFRKAVWFRVALQSYFTICANLLSNFLCFLKAFNTPARDVMKHHS